MTARDEAIEAVYDELGCICKQGDARCYGCISDAERYVDAIPPGVLARLAIEQGGLKRYHTLNPTRHTPPLYRVVEP